MKTFKVAAVQMLSHPGALDENARLMSEFIQEAVAAGAELVVFPEACLTGYSVENAAEIAVEADCPQAAALRDEAMAQGVSICFGYFERNCNSLFITQETVGPDGSFAYRKTHLGQKEQAAFAPGDSLSLAFASEVPVGVHLCWESHFPEIAMTQRAQGAELLAIPFASGMLGQQRIGSWKKTLPARAFDNDCWLIATNALMEKADGSTVGGGIMVVDNKGNVVGEHCGLENKLLVREVGGLLARELDHETMRGIDYFSHRRPDLYE